MRKFALILLLAWSSFPLLGQWVALNSGTSQHLNDIFFLSSAYGVAVGENGTILLTTDSGQSWNAIAQNQLEHFSSVLIWNVDTILVGGQEEADYFTYLTTNGGQQWTVVDDAFELAQAGDRLLSIGYDAFRTSDSKGQSWNKGPDIIGGTTLLDQLKVADMQHISATGNISGFAAYSFYGYRTVDQGDNWHPFYVFDLPNADAWTASSYPHTDTLFVFTNENVNFLPGPNNGLIRLSGFYFDTQNGINSWRFDGDLMNNQMPTYVNDAAFVDGKNGFMVGENGQIYRTNDGGQQWLSQYNGTTNLRGIFLLDSEMAFVVGDDGTLLKNENLTSASNPGPFPDIKIWPNPTHATLNIKGINLPETSINLYDIAGRPIRHYQWSQNQQISLEGLPQGVYELAIKLKWQQLVFKIIKI